MTIARAASPVSLVAAVGIVAGSAFAVCSSPVAAARPVPDGLYRLSFAGTEPSDFDYSEPRGPYTWLLAIRSACPPSGCVATATNVGGVSTTYVFRQSGGRYISSQAQGFTCEGKKTAGISTMSFTASDTTLTGELVESASPCQPISRSFTALREGDLPSGVTVADPNTV
ncbi:hypothetical protein ACIA48_21810 [Mycobacterium sp. NPDC051804]|uniref:hypothetical protein n=1 Tax=Mycobacterium sp. NPDC051804 TaxID=3364295 RepID=UPI00378F8095